MTQDEIDALSPEQKQEFGMYLSRHALVAPGVVMTIETMDVSMDKVAYSAGDTATATLAWTSPVATESLAPNGDTAGLPFLTFIVSLTDNTGAVCGGPVTYSVLVSDTNPSFSIPMTTDCVRPQVLVSATDWNDTSIGSWVVEHPTIEEAYDGWMTVWIILISLAALVILGFVVRRVNGSCSSFANMLKRKE